MRIGFKTSKCLSSLKIHISFFTTILRQQMMAKGDKNNPMAAMMGQMGMGLFSANLIPEVDVLTPRFLVGYFERPPKDMEPP